MNTQHRKTLIPSGKYHCTIRQCYPAGKVQDKRPYSEDTLILCWTVCSDGDYSWRNLIKTFDPTSELQKFNLQDMCKRLNFEMYDWDHPQFYDQWLGLEAVLNVTVDLGKDNRFKKNVILEYSIPNRPPDIDVLAPKDNSHFNSNNNERNLPI